MAKKLFGKASVVFFGVGILLFALLFYYAGFGEIWEAFSAVQSPGYVLAAIALNLLSILCISVRWSLILGDIREKVSIWHLCLLNITGAFVNSITPGPRSGGEPIKAYLLSRIENINKRASLATVVADSYMMFLVFFVLSIVSVMTVLTLWHLPSILYFGSIIGLLFISIIGIPGTFLIFFRGFGTRLIDGILNRILPRLYNVKYFRVLKKKYSTYGKLDHKAKTIVKGFFDMLSRITADGKLLFSTIALSYVAYFLIIMRTHYVLLAFGIELPFIVVLTLAILPELLGLVSWMPGGFAVTELSFVFILQLAAEVTIAEATVIILIIRLISYWFNIVAGFVSTSFLWHIILKTSKEELWKK